MYAIFFDGEFKFKFTCFCLCSLKNRETKSFLRFFFFTEIEKQRPIQRRIRELVLYYISAGQTSLLQVQWSLHWLCLNLYGDNGILRNTGNT